jgi:hypothetical protein
MKQLLLIIFIVNCLGIVRTRAQTYQLIGVVMDSAVRKPISGAMVFVGHTSLRANTDRRGHFTIAQVPLGTVDVVASSSEHRPARLTLRQTSDSSPDPHPERGHSNCFGQRQKPEQRAGPVF